MYLFCSFHVKGGRESYFFYISINCDYFRAASSVFINLSIYPPFMSEGKLLKCRRCGNEWTYKGKSQYYATCTRCLTKVPIKGYKTKS